MKDNWIGILVVGFCLVVLLVAPVFGQYNPQYQVDRTLDHLYSGYGGGYGYGGGAPFTGYVYPVGSRAYYGIAIVDRGLQFVENIQDRNFQREVYRTSVAQPVRVVVGDQPAPQQPTTPVYPMTTQVGVPPSSYAAGAIPQIRYSLKNTRPVWAEVEIDGSILVYLAPAGLEGSETFVLLFPGDHSVVAYAMKMTTSGVERQPMETHLLPVGTGWSFGKPNQ